ncbi:DUF551 domain-containing protein [Escherichia coli]|nr:DUF551 domain-containing protein [Escherichia coli]EFH8186202.1 DUF551 domain-containing protein [Escherichia coli]EJW0402412.1 DUF551 domain-containing protein [Escherichia coli]EKM2783503.1 DUF551 domain-containing protein [Escherichia coli]ELP5138203.1 DUF551 domain-containing protein [Escherichia coli]MBA5769836.1 DUF551 domain-containing protein [Escherichia coli]
MTTISRERIEQYANDPRMCNVNNEIRQIARIALASLEAEPVAWKATFTQIDNEYNTFTALYSDKAEVERWVRLHEIADFRADITPLYTAQPAPVAPDGWISCSERMPNDAQWCVVNTEYGYYVQCWSEGQGWLGDDISIPECDVINWMPLPEPPKEVNRG